jgi:membrane associated rhomboid family serine protease
LIQLGARDTELIVNNNEWYRVVTPMVLHAGIIHYIVNMAAVWFIGIAIEQNHGWVKSLVLFMIPGIGGTILSAIFLPQYISVGASGGIFGLVGGCIADLILHWNLLFIQVLDETPKQVYRRNFFAVFILLLEIFFNIVSVGCNDLSHKKGFFGYIITYSALLCYSTCIVYRHLD